MADRGVTSWRIAFVFAKARPGARRRSHDTHVFVAEAASRADSPLEAAFVESQGMEARSGLDDFEVVRQSDTPPMQRSGTIARQCPRRGHGHAPLATATVAAVRMRMTGCQARAQKIAKEVHGPSPQSSAAAPRGTGRTRLVEAGTSRPGAVAADRFDFCRRHPMQAGAGGATRVYVHGHVKWRTVPTHAVRPSTHALSFRRSFASTLQRHRTPARARHSAASHVSDALS